jgi:hypothetical protein
MYCWAKKNQRFDLVEGSTPSKKTAVRGGAGNVKAPPTPTKDRKRDFIGCRSVRAHIRRERCHWLEKDHRHPEKKKRKHRATKKIDVASTARGIKGMVIHR